MFVILRQSAPDFSQRDPEPPELNETAKPAQSPQAPSGRAGPSAGVSSSTSTPGSKEAPGRRPSAASRSRAATRQRLLESGRFLFAKQGLHGVTTHDIARRAEVAAGTFYLHFKNKRELFREVIQDSVDDLVELIESSVARLESDPQDQRELVRAQAEAMVSFAEDNREVIRMLFSADGDAAAVESDVLNQLASTIAEERRVLVASGREPEGLDPAVLGQAIVGMWAQVLSWWSEDPSRASRESLLETLTRIQLTGTHSI